ncbi:YncE family protein [Candidatus Palauibacter sp.]|uniref:YncE family protein n=1 Tax=Candidatus Palauibacter sp. TaxID=3101350 RepID=UPI003B018C7F
MFSDDLIAVDSETFEEVDRWDISEPFETGLGAMSLPFGESPYQEQEGVYTGLFRMTDPVQNRRLMGFATVDMAAQAVEFHPIGPSEGVSFTLSPDGTKGYGLRSEIGHYEMWKFDLEGRRVSDRITFAGRPRMALMPSADGTKLYIYNAGNTIDVYDEETFELLRTVALDADMTSVVVVPDP